MLVSLFVVLVLVRVLVLPSGVVPGAGPGQLLSARAMVVLMAVPLLGATALTPAVAVTVAVAVLAAVVVAAGSVAM